MDTCAQGVVVNPEFDEVKFNSITFEESMEEELAENRRRLNEKEAAFARLPAAIKRLTRGQARLVGLPF